MRALVRWLWVFALPAFPVGGCNEVTPPPDTVQVRFSVHDLLDEQATLEGATICQTETEPPNCVTTSADGVATLELPANQKVSYTVEKEGYESLLYPVLTGMAGVEYNRGSWHLSNAWLADAFANLRSDYPMTDKGMIHVVIAPRFAGVTLDLVDATGKAWYKDEVDNWSASLQATTSGGIALVERFTSDGGFVEVVPGEHQVEIGGTALGCILGSGDGLVLGWPGDAPNRVLVPVRAGFSTRTAVACAEAP